MSNALTWCSAALTDETTCLDGVPQAGGRQARPRRARREVLVVAQVTSNALALLNRPPGARPLRTRRQRRPGQLRRRSPRRRSPPRSGSGSGPVRDCLKNMADSVGRLRNAAAELARTGAAAMPPGPSSDATVLHALRVRPHADKRIRKYKYAKA
uniref:Pectinesterase inhibitor domain-containing protein n=1 Tax=Ananas comosus var. bracteatus TaxID=296719 RepID=A0A6V7P598_ANACO|nr:unnamed protein product [Ananas comosus var. bracteatus]